MWTNELEIEDQGATKVLDEYSSVAVPARLPVGANEASVNISKRFPGSGFSSRTQCLVCCKYLKTFWATLL